MRVRRGLLGVVAVAAAIVVAACGSSGGKSTTASASSPDSSASAASAKPAIDWAAKYTGGKVGRANPKLSPITVGFFNQENAVPAYPEHGMAAAAAVKFINSNLGGIDGHPLVVKDCNEQTEADAQRCGAYFAGIPGLKLVIKGEVTSSAPMYSTLAGKVPVIAAELGDPADINTKGVYLFNGGPAVLGMQAQTALSLHPKDVSFIGINLPGGVATYNGAFKPAFEAAHVPLHSVLIPANATTPDVVSAMQAAGAVKSAVFSPVINPPQCIAAYKAMQQLGIHPTVVGNYLCDNSTVAQGLGGQYPNGWYFAAYYVSPHIPNQAAGTNSYVWAMQQYATNKAYTYSKGLLSFGDFLLADKLMNKLGPAKSTPSALNNAMLNYRGSLMMIPGTMHCGFNPQAASLCTNWVADSRYLNGKWTQLPSKRIG